MSARELGNAFGNPLVRQKNTTPASTKDVPDLIIRRSIGTDQIVIPDGYKTRRVTLIAPGGAGSNGAATKGGDSGQAGGSAQTFRAVIVDKVVPYSLIYNSTTTASTCSLDGISMTAFKGALAGSTLQGTASITAGVAFTGAAGNVGQTGTSATVTSDGAPSALPGITGYDAGGSGAGGGGYGTYFGVGGLNMEGALTPTAATGSAAGSVGLAKDVVIDANRNGSLGAVIIELWK